jgi:hypothetical protein
MSIPSVVKKVLSTVNQVEDGGIPTNKTTSTLGELLHSLQKLRVTATNMKQEDTNGRKTCFFDIPFLPTCPFELMQTEFVVIKSPDATDVKLYVASL